MPKELDHGFIMCSKYITPSSDHSLLTLNLPLKVILRKLRMFSDWGLAMNDH